MKGICFLAALLLTPALCAETTINIEKTSGDWVRYNAITYDPFEKTTKTFRYAKNRSGSATILFLDDSFAFQIETPSFFAKYYSDILRKNKNATWSEGWEDITYKVRTLSGDIDTIYAELNEPGYSEANRLSKYCSVGAEYNSENFKACMEPATMFIKTETILNYSKEEPFYIRYSIHSKKYESDGYKYRKLDSKDYRFNMTDIQAMLSGV